MVAKGCSGARGGGQGVSLGLRGLLVQPAALLFRFPAQFQEPGIEVKVQAKSEEARPDLDQHRC